MHCPQCSNVVRPGLEVVVVRPGEREIHCPYCLAVVTPDAPGSPRDISVERFALRRAARERFVARLAAGEGEGAIHCTSCGENLLPHVRLQLASSEHFNCPRCAHDLAEEAYRREAYDRTRWERVFEQVERAQRDERCARCSYLCAAARACVDALQRLPGASREHHGALTSLAQRTRHELPDLECGTECTLRDVYHQAVGSQLLVL